MANGDSEQRRKKVEKAEKVRQRRKEGKIEPDRAADGRFHRDSSCSWCVRECAENQCVTRKVISKQSVWVNIST